MRCVLAKYFLPGKARMTDPRTICARMNQKAAILKGFKVRLQDSREQEIQTVLAEIGKIAWRSQPGIVSGA
jgi:2-oxo-4-hydroxy-4-carboxy--5-ureidoimidazoline (OHCU) decarboxylase